MQRPYPDRMSGSQEPFRVRVRDHDGNALDVSEGGTTMCLVASDGTVLIEDAIPQAAGDDGRVEYTPTVDEVTVTDVTDCVVEWTHDDGVEVVHYAPIPVRLRPRGC